MKAKSEYVYVISGPGRHKVGIAANVEHRLREHKSVGARAVVKTWHRPKDARKVEYTVRELLKEHRALGFEWFTCPIERVIDAVESAIELVEAGAEIKSPSQITKENRAKRDEFWTEWRAEYDRLCGEVNQWATDNPEEFNATLAALNSPRST
jgi:hypothetical protein